MEIRKKSNRAIRAAEGYLELNMPRHALRELDRIPQGQHTARLERVRANALRMDERFEEAIDVFRKLLATDTKDVDALSQLAWCFKRVGRIDDAINAAECAYRSRPKQSILLYNLACYHNVAGNRDRALSWLGRALRMEPKLVRFVMTESDFDSLRNDDDFGFIVHTVGSHRAGN